MSSPSSSLRYAATLQQSTMRSSTMLALWTSFACPTRYPNGLARGAPVEFYTRPEAQRAIADAAAVIPVCRRVRSQQQSLGVATRSRRDPRAFAGTPPCACGELLEVLEVRLFGSFARGDARPGSDADFSLVVGDTPKAFVERIAALARRLSGVGIGCEVVVCTKREPAALGAQGGRFAPQCSPQKRPYVDRSKPAIASRPDLPA